MGSDSPIASRAEEVLQLFRKGAEFTQELIQENERLRYRILELERQSVDRPEVTGEITDQNRRLLERIVELERERDEILASLARIEEQSRNHALRQSEIEQENRSLARLYAAAYELHSTLDFDDVLRLLSDVQRELIGAESFIVYLADEEDGTLSPVCVEGEATPPERVVKGEGLVGITFLTGENVFFDDMNGSPIDENEPLAAVPLTIRESVIGVIAIHRLTPPKSRLTPLDQKLLTLLAGQAATAIFAAKLYQNSTRKLNTIKGFLDLLKNQE